MSFDPDDIWLDKIKGFDHVPQQVKRRLYRIAMVGFVGVSYLLDTILLSLFVLVGTINVEVPLYYGLAGLGHVLLFSLLHWTGFSERFENPHMVGWGMAYSIGAQLLGISLAPKISVFFLGLIFVIFAFGMLRLSFRDALIIWFLSMISVCVTMLLSSGVVIPLVRPSLAESSLVVVSFALILLRAIALGYYAQMLRMRMYDISRSFENDAIHDALTGVYNRRALDTILQGQISLHKRKQIPCALAMIDIDHFKRINDKYGHAVGDRVLKEMAQVLLLEIRESDKLLRYGGEEFLLVMAATDLEEAEQFAERIRAKVAITKWQYLPEGIKITISIGLTELLENDRLESPLNRSDTAMYAAKKSGRDRLVIYTDSPEA